MTLSNNGKAPNMAEHTFSIRSRSYGADAPEIVICRCCILMPKHNKDTPNAEKPAFLYVIPLRQWWEMAWSNAIVWH